MRIVIQRAASASVTADGCQPVSIGCGLVVLVGVTQDDTESDAGWLAAKTTSLRIFDDENGIMNRSVADVGGEILAISQFTLYASTRRGNRPSYVHAAPGSVAEPLYEAYVLELERILGHAVGRGVFGAHMLVELVNDGPVTIIIDSKQRE